MAALSPQELLARLAKGKPVPAILLLGADRYLRDLCRKKLVKAYVAEGARDWGVRRFSAGEDDAAAILGQARTMPMLAPLQVLFVGETENWERLGDDSRDALVKEIAEYLDSPAPFTLLVFEAAELDQRMRLGKLLVEKALAVSVELSGDATERARLAAPVAADMARELGVTLETDAADELCDILNGDLAAIRTEIDKLAAYAGDRKKIRRADVRSSGHFRAHLRSVGLGGHAGGKAAAQSPQVSGPAVARRRGGAGACGHTGMDVQEASGGAGTAAGRPRLASGQPPQNASGWRGACGAAMPKVSAGAAHDGSGGLVRSGQPAEIRGNESARRDGISGDAAGPVEQASSLLGSESFAQAWRASQDQMETDRLEACPTKKTPGFPGVSSQISNWVSRPWVRRPMHLPPN